MAKITLASLVPLTLFLTMALALPFDLFKSEDVEYKKQFQPRDYPSPLYSLTSGAYLTGTATGTGTGYPLYPTATGSSAAIPPYGDYGSGGSFVPMHQGNRFEGPRKGGEHHHWLPYGPWPTPSGSPTAPTAPVPTATAPSYTMPSWTAPSPPFYTHSGFPLPTLAY